VSQPARLRAVLDVDIIYSRVLHELLGRIARRIEVVAGVWSACREWWLAFPFRAVACAGQS
jgi:hypothetical protein